MKCLILLLLLIPSFQICAQEKAEVPRKGKITGRVLGDDGQPLEGAQVSVASSSNKDTTGWHPVITDDEGNFSIDGLKAGSYRLYANSPGLITPDFSSEIPSHHPGESATLSLVKGGVITGRVTDSLGAPVIAAPIQITRIHDLQGRRTKDNLWFAQRRKTDDKGNYRVYGLPSGKYLVSVGGKSAFGIGLPNGYESLAQIYYPSASRETATEVAVNAGEEVSGINIQFHAEKGHSISGKITGGTTEISVSSISVELRTPTTFSFIAVSSLLPGATRDFSLFGIADGEYQIQANHNDGWGPAQKDSYRSVARKITVKGGNISGVVLPLLPLSSVAGKVEFAETPEKNQCQPSRPSSIEEIAVTLRRETIGKDAESNPDLWSFGDAPNESGEIRFSNLEAARYRVMAKFPSESWYLKSVTTKLPTTKPVGTKAGTLSPLPVMVDLGKTGLSLSPGEKMKDLLVTISDGAANLKGSIVTDPKNALPARMRVFLIPAGKEFADDLLRYYEAKTKTGAFAFENLAPGKYLLLARPIAETESDEILATPTAWEGAARLPLRREAEAAKQMIELSVCQKVRDFTLSFAAK